MENPEHSYENVEQVITIWKENKLEDICFVLSQFVNYILKDRPGFTKYENPVISEQIVKYVIESLFGCESFDNKHIIPPEDFKKMCIKLVMRYTESDNLSISSSAVLYIYNFINSCQNLLFENIELRLNKEIQKIRTSILIDTVKKKREHISRIKDKFSDDKLKTEFGEKMSIFIKVLAKVVESMKKCGEFNDLFEGNKLWRKAVKKGDKDKIKKYEKFTVIKPIEIDEFTTEDISLRYEITGDKKPNYIRKLIKRQAVIKEDKFRDLSSWIILKEYYEAISKYYTVLDYYQNILQNSKYFTFIFIKTTQGYSLGYEELWANESVRIKFREMMGEAEENMRKSLEVLTDTTNIKKNAEENLVQILKKDISHQVNGLSNLKIEDYIVKSLIYVCITLCDWLELDHITEDEMKYCLLILLPRKLHHFLEIRTCNDENKEFSSELTLKFVKSLKEKGMKISKKDFDKLDSLICPIIAITELEYDFEGGDNSFQLYDLFVNRLKFFSLGDLSKI